MLTLRLEYRYVNSSTQNIFVQNTQPNSDLAPLYHLGGIRLCMLSTILEMESVRVITDPDDLLVLLFFHHCPHQEAGK